MNYFVPIRKFVKVLWTNRTHTRREREHYNENSTKNTQKSNSLKLILLLLITVLTYCIYLLVQNAGRSSILTSSVKIPKFTSSEDAIAAMRREFTNSSKMKEQKDTRPACFLDWRNFGIKVVVNKTLESFDPEKEYPMIQKGGYYRPGDCKPRHKVGILVPYRDREANLAVFLYNIHPFLMRQKLEYRIFVIEQKGAELFNRGRLFNAGYLEMKKFGAWSCVVFHDVDLLPLDNRILYSCPTWPRHMCASVREVTDPKFRTRFGGVSSMSPQTMEKVNGYSNLYWGWGGEDDDMFWRIRYSGYPVVRYNKNISRYTALHHRPNSSANRLRYFLLSTTRNRYQKDGLSSLEYKVESVTLHHLYTHILVDVNLNRENVTEILYKWKQQWTQGVNGTTKTVG